jgi:hypothetical protein
MTTLKQRGVWTWVISLIAIGFGLLTIREGGAVLFVDGAGRAAAGNYVPFVLWFNFVAGFAYVIAGVGLWTQQPWAVWLAIAIAAGTALTFIAFGVHVYFDGVYEQRTVIAMSLRTLVWASIAIAAWRLRVFGMSGSTGDARGASAPQANRTGSPTGSQR